MPDRADLFAAARAARDGAYAPYSRFAVGAALETAGGRWYTGANVANASYGLSMCAERVAAQAAVAAGERAFAALAIAGPDGVTTVPCGACRQVLAEFGTPAMPVVYGSPAGPVETTLGALFPLAFTARALDAAARGVD